MATAATRVLKVFRLQISPEKGSEILGVVLVFLVVLLATSLLSFYPQDPSVLHHNPAPDAPTHNLIGPVGAQLAAILFGLLGLTAFLVPVLVGVTAWRRFRPLEEEVHWKERSAGLVLVLVALPAMQQLLIGKIGYRGVPLDSGGVIGVLLQQALANMLNASGAFLVLATMLIVGSILVAHTTLGDVLRAARVYLTRLMAFVGRFKVARVRHHKRRDDELTRRRVFEHHRREVAEKRRPEATDSKAKGSKATDSKAAPPLPPAEPLPLKKPPKHVVTKEGEGQFSVRKVEPRQPAAPPPPPKQETLDFPDEILPVELPPVNLLHTDGPKSEHDDKELLLRGVAIRQAASQFGVEGQVEGVSPGPVITTYEFQPAPGVKVSRIVALQDDLALTLKAESVRIDRLAGRSTLGIEVPNGKRSIINLGSLFAQDAFSQAASPLTMAIGVDIYGRPYFADLATMPHLLVAGATGAGKSVGLQSMITSILYKATREQVQFIFIDPKRIELGVYADIPHLKTEVVVEPKKAANALRWAVAEMERRYRLLAEVHVRSIAYYNRAICDPEERQRLALKDGESEFRPEDFKPLPYYVIIIDELADLMMVSSSDVETSIARLAQMARAVGIHLIIATQRPSVDVLTGTIKANFPCRLSFATATRHDSRTILDQIGAEKLLGKGDALFMPPGTSRHMRLHGAYISEQETATLVRWLKSHGKAELDPDVVKDPEEKVDASGGRGGGDDALYDEAARLVVKERQASASYLQRRMRVGFSRAARLVDMLEADGILGPTQKGAKSRDVLVPPDYFDEVDQAHAQE
jgi:S-DNA-T family DNA segregation ATPase FtsK/SpoIIIE